MITGRNGDLLRQKKKQTVRYSFTAEELEKHDKAIRAAYRELIEGKLKKQLLEYDRQQDEEIEARVNRLWKERWNEFNNGTDDDQMNTWVAYMLAAAVKVLVERFGWTPIRNRHKTRLQRFAEGVIEELVKVQDDKTMDVIRFADEVEKLYGVRFNAGYDEDADV